MRPDTTSKLILQLRTSSDRNLFDCAKVVGWRTPLEHEGAFAKWCRLNRREFTPYHRDRLIGLIAKWLTLEEFHAIRRRGCVHTVDFPEKRDQSIRNRGPTAA